MCICFTIVKGHIGIQKWFDGAQSDRSYPIGMFMLYNGMNYDRTTEGECLCCTTQEASIWRNAREKYIGH